MSDEEDVYCLCRSSQYDDDTMVGCDRQKDCDIEWYHLACVGLTPDTVPDGDWYCQRCLDACPELAEKMAASQVQGNNNLQKRRIYTCEVCEKDFSEKSACLEHKRQHHAVAAAAAINDITQQVSQTSLSPEIDDARLTDFVNQLSDSISSEEDKPTYSPASDPDLEATRNALKDYSSEEIWKALVDQGQIFACVCGMSFTDQALYHLHRSCHDSTNPLKCSLCGAVTSDYSEFMTHFFQHKESS